jgi:hypothetical protein
MGDGPIFLKTSAPPSLMTTYRMNLLSARSILLDSTFKNVCSYSPQCSTKYEEGENSKPEFQFQNIAG